MSLLAVLAAGGAQGYQQASNANVDMHNKEVLSNREMQQKAWLDKANREYQDYRDTRKMDHENSKLDKEREFKSMDREDQRKFEMEKENLKHDRSMKLEGMRESGRNSRSAERNKILEQKAKSGGGSSEGGAKISDLRNLRNDAASRVESINKMLNDPMASRMSEDRKAKLLGDLDRAERTVGDLTLSINKSLKGTAAPNLQGLLNNTDK